MTRYIPLIHKIEKNMINVLLTEDNERMFAVLPISLPSQCGFHLYLVYIHVKTQTGRQCSTPQYNAIEFERNWSTLEFIENKH
nr:hypothetical protein Itr_chr15CG10030 [Ipomoea trifida]GMD96765.1 hypothetical protein Iba_chr15bCG7930 [Ipomoea batatas]